jgi:hypothetical protein
VYRILIERVMALVEAKTAKVDRWRIRDQKLRRCAAELFAVEKQFQRVRGYDHLPLPAQAHVTKITLSTERAA